MDKQYAPKPLIDASIELQALYKTCLEKNPHQVLTTWIQHCQDLPELPDFYATDFQQVLNFLYSYRGSEDTFNAYRRELERFMQWSWLIRKQSLFVHKRLDIESFVEFCKSPPRRWIGLKTVTRFETRDGTRNPNPNWRPFIVRMSKKSHQDGLRPNKEKFELSQQGLKVIFAVLGSFYNYLIQEEKCEANPVLQIRQKSKFIQKSQQAKAIRRLTPQQWQMVVHSAEKLAQAEPTMHARTLFIMNALYGMYLRVSELSATQNWVPTMGDFFRDANHDWWFKTVGKGNKMRQIAVSDAMLDALKVWRTYLGLSSLPTPDEQPPLIPKVRGQGPVSSTRLIRQIVQQCFDVAVDSLKNQGEVEEADMLRAATVHWLRHTGISDDVKHIDLVSMCETMLAIVQVLLLTNILTLR